MDWLNSVISGDPTDLSRVSVAGLAVTVIGVAVYVLVPMALRKFELPARLTGIAITVLGALMSMKII
ncbi:MAG: hypothetical protein Q4D04_09855 [Clostridia bacterium]|nr:hypothetical protein [Clostridia bacterium]